MKLKLNKLSKGRYQNRAGDVLLTVENQHNGFWIGRVEVFTHIAKDFSGNNVEMFDELYFWTSPTKREIVSGIIEFINKQ